jgi:hypothetical protein
MDSIPNGIRGQLARLGDLVIAQPAHLAHQEHVALQFRQRRECLIECRCGFLRRVPRLVECPNGLFRPPLSLAVMVEYDVPSDPKQPPGQLVLRRLRDGNPADPQKHLLRQVPGEFGFARGAAQIPAEPVLVQDDERLSIGWHGQLLSGTLGGPYPLKFFLRALEFRRACLV